MWSPTGREIFYRSLDGSELWSMPVEPGSGEFGSPRLLFAGPYRLSGGFFSDYDVSASGEEFLMMRLDGDTAPDELHVVVNAAGSTR